MVTRATKKPIATETTKEAGGPTHSEQETPKHIVVAITAGHLFKENDDAFFVRNDKNEKFGKCLAKLHRKGHISTKKYDIAVIELDENMKTSEDCDAKFRNENGESCDGVLFKGTLASGTVMYKKGAATGMSAGVVVSPDFRLVGHDDTQKGYLIKGRDDRDFANLGDSGSIVFTLDTNDEENRTVNLVSIVTKTLSKDLARIPEIPGTLAYIVRLDRCLEQLEKLTGVAVHMPKK
ncbi:uncharacterized protein LOC110464272 [Mizuhopecten yessoensis]|uniref:uncharacterized protein LOC110464272 n=1 Tax=Mizuhopecten yessoensis TaxID=6573 RepID=UPI000B45C3D1|nr:uncharacterized protein LOC110464272 [Mizuhopecten yessoensis]